MYYLNKIIGFVASPFGVAIAGLVIAVVCASLKRVRWAKWIGGVTVIWLWLWATPIMTRFVGAPLEREFLVDGRVPAVESFPKADVIVLLGGSMGREERLSPYAEMWTSADRVWQAARLWKAGKAPKIIATGNGAEASTLGLLLDFGVGKDDITFMDARNTEEEARGIWGLLNVEKGKCENVEMRECGNGSKRILLVTSAWHMKRARMMFEKYAPEIEVICAPADFEYSMAASKPFSFKEFLPDATVFMVNSVVSHEWLGIFGYKLFR